MKQLVTQRAIDLHFCENKDMISPFARFEPTDAGWDAAVEFVRMKSG